MNGPFTKDHTPHSEECEMYVNGSIDDLSVVAEQCCRDNELSADDISCDQSRQVIPWQHKYTRESWIMGKRSSVSPAN